MAFVHLHAHTEYSIDGIAKIREMFPYAWHNGMPGLAITDHGTLSGVPEFLSAAEQYPEVKPVVGCEFWITDHYDHTLKDDKHGETFHLILLAKNLTGYHNLVKLCSIANCEGVYHGKPRISHKLFVFTRKWLTHRAHQVPFCARGLLKIIAVSENAPGAHGNVPRVGRDSTTRQRFHGSAMFHASAEIPQHGKDSTVQQSSTVPRCSAPRPPSTAPAGNLGGTVRAERSLYQSSDEDCLRDL